MKHFLPLQISLSRQPPCLQMETSPFLNPDAPTYIPVSRRFLLPHLIVQPSHSLYNIPQVYTTTAPFQFQNELRPPPTQPPRAENGYYRRQRRERKPLKEVIHLKHDEDKTTIIIKNIPNKYTRELLVKVLENHCSTENEKVDVGSEVSAFDFIYLPMDFRTGANKGFACVNFTNTKGVWKFFEAFNGKQWELFQSPKTIQIVSAKWQGKEALMNHFTKSKFACETDEYLPLSFSPPRDGSGGSEESSTTVGKRISILGSNIAHQISNL